MYITFYPILLIFYHNFVIFFVTNTNYICKSFEKLFKDTLMYIFITLIKCHHVCPDTFIKVADFVTVEMGFLI